MYDMNGKKTKMTEAHLYNLMQGIQKAIAAAENHIP